MSLTPISITAKEETSTKTKLVLSKLEKLIDLLNEKSLEPASVSIINAEIEKINGLETAHNKQLKKALEKSLRTILKHLETKYKWVPNNHYQNLWMALGMSCFGIPMGVALGATQGNMAFIGMGLPFGMLFGIALGSQMDKKAAKEGRQLHICEK